MISNVKVRLFWILLISGLLGVVSFSLVDLSALMALMPAPPPGSEFPEITPAFKVLALIQPTILVLAAVVIGIVLSPRVGLRAPAAEALASGVNVLPPLRAQLVPGLLGGLVGAFAIVLTSAITKPFLREETLDRIHSFMALMPFPTRLLYGGVTEELLIRWGLMTFLVWAIWRLLQRGVNKPTSGHFVAAILISAFLFGIGHLPIAMLVLKEITLAVLLFVILANSAFGIVAGFLYWKRGLEAAIIAHMLCHVLLALASYAGAYF